MRLLSGSMQVSSHSTRPLWQDSAHWPRLQTSPSAQPSPALPPLSPQPSVAPQKSRSIFGSTQTPPQSTYPARHEGTQAPFLHTEPSAQSVPALPPLSPQPSVAPQKSRLVKGSTQVPLQATRLSAQFAAHSPELQTCPSTHTLPSSCPMPQPVAPQ